MTKFLTLSAIFYLIISILISRLDVRDDIGIYTMNFLNMNLGVIILFISLVISYWFTEKEIDKKQNGN